jgi:hypothetical protein
LPAIARSRDSSRLPYRKCRLPLRASAFRCQRQAASRQQHVIPACPWRKPFSARRHKQLEILSLEPPSVFLQRVEFAEDRYALDNLRRDGGQERMGMPGDECRLKSAEEDGRCPARGTWPWSELAAVDLAGKDQSQGTRSRRVSPPVVKAQCHALHSSKSIDACDRYLALCVAGIRSSWGLTLHSIFLSFSSSLSAMREIPSRCVQNAEQRICGQRPGACLSDTPL